MTLLVDDLLLLSRADAGALRWDVAPVELDRLVEEVAKEGEILGRGKQVQVKILELEPLVIQGDGQRLKQLLRNLVDNGVKYTPSGGEVTLALRATRPRAPGPNSKFDTFVPSPSTGLGFRAGSRDSGRGIRNSESPDWSEIEVRDTGIGIPAEELPRIFERFYRVDPVRSRETGGAGLGLCIAKTIAEAHGGRIDVHSSPGAGSTFTLLLPVRR